MQRYRRQTEAGSHGGSDEGLKGLLDQLVELFETEAARDPQWLAQQWGPQWQKFRREMAAATRSEDLPETGAACVEACRQYLALRRSHVEARETEFRGLIDILSSGLKSLAAETGAFTATLTSASQRMSALVGVDDIQMLKRQLSHEVSEIKRVVVEKQRNHEAVHSRLAQRIDTLESTLVQTRVAAPNDTLSQVASRGTFDAMLGRWVESCQQTRQPFVLVLIDVDHFKQINDTHGHPAGDRALIGAAGVLKQSVRPCDLVARYGGDEFALLLANMTLAQAEKRLAEIVARLAGRELRDEPSGAAPIRVTISCGMVQFERQDSAQTLLQRADEGLYAAKQQGRNCTVTKHSSLWRSWRQ